LEKLREEEYEAIFFDDATFTNLSEKRKKEVKNLAETLYSLGYKKVGCQTRADFLDREVLENMTLGGKLKWYCAIGLESANQRILEAMGKKFSKEQVESALIMLREYELDVGI